MGTCIKSRRNGYDMNQPNDIEGPKKIGTWPNGIQPTMCKNLSGQKKLGQQNRQIKLPQNHGRRWILMPGYSLIQMPWDCPGIKLEAATDKPNNWEFLIFQRPWPRNWLLDQQNKNLWFDCCIESISQVFVDRNRFRVTSSGPGTTHQTFHFSNGSMDHSSKPYW